MLTYLGKIEGDCKLDCSVHNVDICRLLMQLLSLSPSSKLSLQRKLVSKQAHRATRVYVPVVSAAVWLRATETQISATLWS